MVTGSDKTARLVVLIDADKAQPAAIGALLAEVAKFGSAHVKRAYADWTGTSLKGWKDPLLAQSTQPIQQFAYTRGARTPRRAGAHPAGTRRAEHTRVRSLVPGDFRTWARPAFRTGMPRGPVGAPHGPKTLLISHVMCGPDNSADQSPATLPGLKVLHVRD